MNVAVCLSGQPRTFEHSVYYIREYFKEVPGVTVDFYLFLWDSDMSYTTRNNQSKVQAILSREELIRRVQEIYPAGTNVIVESEENVETVLRTIYPLSIGSDYKNYGFLGGLGMNYHIASSLQMVQRSGKYYDWVFWTRPDVYILDSYGQVAQFPWNRLEEFVEESGFGRGDPDFNYRELTIYSMYNPKDRSMNISKNVPDMMMAGSYKAMMMLGNNLIHNTLEHNEHAACMRNDQGRTRHSGYYSPFLEGSICREALDLGLRIDTLQSEEVRLFPENLGIWPVRFWMVDLLKYLERPCMDQELVDFNWSYPLLHIVPITFEEIITVYDLWKRDIRVEKLGADELHEEARRNETGVEGLSRKYIRQILEPYIKHKIL